MTVEARFRAAVISLIVPVVVLVLWWVLSADSTSAFYPPLQTIWESFKDTWLFSHVGSDVVPSFIRFGLGYALAVLLGVFFGVLFGRLRLLDMAFQPSVQFARSIPATGLVPVSITLMGIGNAPKIWLIGFVCMFPILLNTIDGVTSIGAARAQTAQVFRIPARDVLFHIVLPGASPKIFAGMRTSLSLSLILMIISELQKSENGLGYLLVQSQRNFDYASFWSVLVALVILGVIFNLVFLFIERRVLAWHRGATAQHD